MLSATARYALRALVNLAAEPDGKPLLGKDLSKAADIPPNYLSKILWTLGSEGYITATRGTRGGYRLERRPEEIRLADIVELFDPARIAAGCLLHAGQPCSEETACAAHETWKHVKAAYTEFLEQTTLAALVENHARGSRGESVL